MLLKGGEDAVGSTEIGEIRMALDGVERLAPAAHKCNDEGVGRRRIKIELIYSFG